MARGRSAGRPDLTGKVAVVTGAARGLGEAVALRLAARGARPALVGLEPDALAGVADRCGPDAAWFEADVTDGAAMERVAAQVAERFGRIDVVVVNAGIAVGGPLLVSDPVSYDRVVEVNLVGSIRTARAFLPHLVSTRGYLLQVASLAAMTPNPSMGAYCASKAGVESFAHCLAAEVAHHGVGVGVAYLSWTDTDMVRGADEHATMRESRKKLPPPFRRTYPLGPAADRITEGIARRAGHVYGQGWVRAMQPIRWTVPGVIRRLAVRDMAQVEQDARAAGIGSTVPVGAGGAADIRARQR